MGNITAGSYYSNCFFLNYGDSISMKSPSGYAIINMWYRTINALYSRHFISCGNISFNLFKTPVIFEHLFEILSVCFFPL